MLTVASDAADAIAVTRGADGNVKVNSADPTTGGPAAAAAVRQIRITGGPGANLIDLSGVVPASFPALQAVSVIGADGSVTPAPSATADDAARILAPGTPIGPANTTFRVPFADLHPVAFFPGLPPVVIDPFDNDPIRFADQFPDPARGAVVALVGPCIPGRVQRIDLHGDGGAVPTDRVIADALTSTGPLGDLTLASDQAVVADVTAPSILGNLDAGGPIESTLQTTGLRTDPLTMP